MAKRFLQQVEQSIIELLGFTKWMTLPGLVEVDSLPAERHIRAALKSLELKGKIKSAMWTPLPGGIWERTHKEVRGQGSRIPTRIWFLSEFTYEEVRRFE